MTTGRINQVFTTKCPSPLQCRQRTSTPLGNGAGEAPKPTARASRAPGLAIQPASEAPSSPASQNYYCVPSFPPFEVGLCRTVRLSKTIGIPVHKATRANTSDHRRSPPNAGQAWQALPVYKLGGPNQHSQPRRHLLAFPTAKLVRHVLHQATQSKSNSSRYMQRDSLSPHI